jgi:hypothetical protein
MKMGMSESAATRERQAGPYGMAEDVMSVNPLVGETNDGVQLQSRSQERS